MLDSLEDWLYSPEADDADLAALKTKRSQVAYYCKSAAKESAQNEIAPCFRDKSSTAQTDVSHPLDVPPSDILC